MSAPWSSAQKGVELKQLVRSFVALGVLFFGVAATARPAFAETSHEKPLPPALAESIDVRVVNLEAVVTEHGVPVHGLSPGDFRLCLNDEEQPIEYFSEVIGGVAGSDEADPETGTPGIPSLASGEPIGVSYLVFIDDYFSIAQDRNRVLDALDDQLADLRPEDRMAIVAYDGNHVEMLSSWSRPGPFLEHAIQKARRRPALGLQRWSERQSFEITTWLPAKLRFRQSRFQPAGMGGQLSPDEHFYARLLEDQVEREVMAVSATLRGFGAAPGRRVALLLSGGWPYDIPAYVTGEIARPSLEHGFLAPSKLFQPLVETANRLGWSWLSLTRPADRYS